MTLSASLIFAAATILPIVTLILIARIKTARRTAVPTTADAFEASALYIFEPQADPAPRPFLRRFTLPQRTYLNQ